MKSSRESLYPISWNKNSSFPSSFDLMPGPRISSGLMLDIAFEKLLLVLGIAVIRLFGSSEIFSQIRFVDSLSFSKASIALT